MPRSPNRPLRRLPALAAGLAAAFVLAPAAHAAGITESHVTTPIDRTLLVQNQVSEPSKTFTVAGTTNGTTGESVDIRCYQGTGSVGGYTAGIPVEADGSFSASIPESSIPTNTCALLAVPHGTTPAPGGVYTGPRVGFSSFSTSTVPSGPNAGDAYDFTFGDETMAAQGYVYSIDDCGPIATLLDGTPAVNYSGYLLDCPGNLYNSPAAFSSSKEVDLTRAELQVDGQNSYGTDSAFSLFARKGEELASDELPGFPVLSATLTASTVKPAKPRPPTASRSFAARPKTSTKRPRRRARHLSPPASP